MKLDGPDYVVQVQCPFSENQINGVEEARGKSENSERQNDGLPPRPFLQQIRPSVIQPRLLVGHQMIVTATAVGDFRLPQNW